MTAVPRRQKTTAYTVISLVATSIVTWLLVTFLNADPGTPTATVPRGSHPETRSSEELGKAP